MKKHTPGPWKVEYDNSDRAQYYKCGPVTISFDHNPSDEEDERCWADAHLISAAPDMLEALEAMMNYGEDWPTFANALDKAKKAIRKAKGDDE